MDAVPAAVDALLAAMATGEWSPVGACITDDVVYDASVPGWHFAIQGADAVLAELRGRCPGHDDHPAHEEASRNALVFEIDDAGRISELRLICCGDWDEETIARIDAEAPRLTREVAA